jgi:hypothetical protein
MMLHYFCKNEIEMQSDCIEKIAENKLNLSLFFISCLSLVLFFPFQNWLTQSIPIFKDWTYEMIGVGIYHICILMGITISKSSSPLILWLLTIGSIIFQIVILFVDSYLIFKNAQYFVICLNGLINILNGYVNASIYMLFAESKFFDFQILIWIQMICHLIGMQISITTTYLLK